MVNSQVVAEIVNALKLDSNVDKIPPPTPVVEVGSKLVKNLSITWRSQTTSGAVDLLSAITGDKRDIYVYGIAYSYAKDVVCDVASGSIGINCFTDGGTAKSLIACSVISLTAQSSDRELIFTHPIKLDKGSAVTMTGTFTAGVLIRTAVIYYYYDDIL